MRKNYDEALQPSSYCILDTMSRMSTYSTNMHEIKYLKFRDKLKRLLNL